MDTQLKIDKKVIEDLIEDLEKASKIINFRLSQLYTMVGKKHNNFAVERNDIKQKIEEMRRQAMSQIQSKIPNMPSIPKIPK